MDAEKRDKLWRVMAELGRARDRFFIHFSGAGRDVDLRDELLVMEAAAKRALALLDVPCTMYHVPREMYHVPCKDSRAEARDGREEVRHG